MLSFVEHAFPGEKLRGKKILDIGYGAPEHLEYLASKGAEAHGIDQHFEYPDSGISGNLVKDHFKNILKHFEQGSFDTIISKGAALSFLKLKKFKQTIQLLLHNCLLAQ